MNKNAELIQWVERVAALTKPESVYWCNGTDEERDELTRLMLGTGELIQLNQDTHPNCFLHRSDPDDVARVEHLTYVCCPDEEDAGINNNLMSPEEAHTKIDNLFEGCMRGRVMYVIPYLMGPYGSPFSRAGVEITDSPYVVLNMRIMTRIGDRVLDVIDTSKSSFVKGLHSIGDLNPERRLIMHFPDELVIKSFGSGYGGNALLGKKCHALRLASAQARREGWLAEHMLILGIESPAGDVDYIAAAFPSACGKTNLAMLVPPEQFSDWKIWTVGDDIAWMHVGDDGRLWAINPEAGFFGVAPGTSLKTNPNCMNTLGRDSIYTNVAVDSLMRPWWEGIDGEKPASLTDWRGRKHELVETEPAAHPNARFTVSASQCPSFSPKGNSPNGVPISAIVFGGRRSSTAPLVFQAFDWEHGVFAGASMASETTAAATGAIGQVRRDPMAMKPFCGYNFGDYWKHWLSFKERSNYLPQIFHVNWFRKDENGDYLWPGFSENMRVLNWILKRCRGEVAATKSPIGMIPEPDDINLEGLSIAQETLESLLSVEPTVWKKELVEIDKFFDSFGPRVPKKLKEQSQRISRSLKV